MIIRKPRLILDFSLTLVFNHLVLTTYYSASVPTSLFFWLVVGTGAMICIIFGEQLCVKREMRDGMAVMAVPQDEEEAEDMEMGRLPRRD
jgi:protein SYS1